MCETVLLMLQPSHFSSYWDIGHFTMKHVTSNSYIPTVITTQVALSSNSRCWMLFSLFKNLPRCQVDWLSKTTVCSISLWLQKTPNFDLSADGDDSESWCSFFFYFAKQLCFKARTSRCRWWRSIKVPTQCPAVRYSCHQERHFAVSATTPNTTRMPGQENNKNKKWKPNNNLTCRRILILLLFQQSP